PQVQREGEGAGALDDVDVEPRPCVQCAGDVDLGSSVHGRGQRERGRKVDRVLRVEGGEDLAERPRPIEEPRWRGKTREVGAPVRECPARRRRGERDTGLRRYVVRTGQDGLLEL